MDNSKILTRIRNLLAMAGDTGSPNEAAIAARRARKLMDEYQINEMDLTTVEGDDMGANSTAAGGQKASTFHGRLAVSVARLNDVQTRYARNRITGKLDIRFEGLLVDTVCAVELFRYLTHEAYKQAERKEQGRADRHAYRLGFASGVDDQIDEILEERNRLKTATGQSLVVCKMALVKQHFDPVKYRNTRDSYAGGRSSYQSGHRAGQKAGLNRQVGGESQKRLA
jgi:hypothetical protein